MTQPDTDRYQRGVARLSEIHNESGQAVIDALKDVSPDLTKYIFEFSFGDIYSRPGLSLHQRQMATIAMLGTLGTAAPQLKPHIHAALNVGVTKAEIVEVFIQLAVYAGFPAAVNAMMVAKEVFAERPEAA